MRVLSPRALARALALAAVVVAAPVAFAGDPKPTPKPPPTMASDADAAAALAKFKEDYKAKGLKGEDRLSQKDFALGQLAKLQHPTIVEAIAAVARESDPTLRMLGTAYLGDETLMPGLAGKNVVIAWKRGQGDDALDITAMQSIARLKYLGAKDELRTALKDQSFAVKKVAIGAIAVTGDLRLVHDLLALVGVQVPANTGQGVPGENADGKGDTKTPGGKEVVSEGYSWEGAEATVDWGLSDNSAENAEAERQVKEQIAKNQAAAESAAKNGSGSGGGTPSGGGAGGGGGGGGESAPGRGGGGRSTSELLPLVLGALQRLTGQTFTGPAQFKRWWTENSSSVAERVRFLDEKEKKQKDEAAAQSK